MATTTRHMWFCSLLCGGFHGRQNAGLAEEGNRYKPCITAVHHSPTLCTDNPYIILPPESPHITLCFISSNTSCHHSISCDHVASHVGKAQSICNLIRGIPYNASKGRVAIPLDVLASLFSDVGISGEYETALLGEPVLKIRGKTS
ncbi:NADH dehydrogenase (ubiquinone) complex I, assembly factor 6 [Nymphon striatum]|nr:NADH dehydrogenase (ubiquinone) complex I, assembly factor 6 [Nymphon striatum]